MTYIKTEIKKGEVFYFAKKPHKLHGRRPYSVENGMIKPRSRSYEEMRIVENFDKQGIYNVICWESSKEIFVLEFWKRYPCFDSSDYDFENRYYRFFMLCNSRKEAEEKLKYRIEKVKRERQQKWGDSWREIDDLISSLGVSPDEEELSYCVPCVYYDDGEYKETYFFYEK